MPNKVTMDTIAKKLGISKNTVSLALRGMPGINDITRKTIRDVADSMGYLYKPNSTKLRTTKNLCLVIARSTRDSIGFFSFIQLGIENEARKNCVNTIIHYYNENEEGFEMPNCIREGMISGIITLGRISRKTINTIASYKLPIVMVDNYFDDLIMDCILTDNQSGGYHAAKCLIKNGHRKIGFIGDVDKSVSFYDRFQGYLKALREFDIEFDEGYTLVDKKLEYAKVEDVAAIIKEIKAKRELPSAYVCCNDVIAIMVIKAIQSIGISIPNDISIIGFDDIETARNITPELTTMRVQKELMGKRAVCRLLEKIEDGEEYTTKILLSAALIKRKSVKQV